MTEDFEFEVSDFLIGDTAVIPLNTVDSDLPICDISIDLSDSACARAVTLDLSAVSNNINNLSIRSTSICLLGFKFQDEAPDFVIENLYCRNIQFDQTCEVLNVETLKMDAYNISTYLPLSSENIEINIIPNHDILALQDLITGVNMLPGSGEYVYETRSNRQIEGTGRNICTTEDGSASAIPPVTEDLNDKQAPSLISLEQLATDCPKAKWVAPTVAWYATSKEAGECEIYPAVEFKGSHRDIEIPWKVEGYDRGSAYEISKDGAGRPNYGGTVNDESVLNYLDALKENGYKVMFYPMLFLDVAGKPWRGFLTGDASNVENFFLNEHGYNRFILHYANLVKGKVDAFIIGSEFRDLTKVNDGAGNYPAVDNLIELSRNVRHILGDDVVITYAADWSEYHHTDGGMRHLDKLWADTSIDVVGIDAYFPITAKEKGEITSDEIKHGWFSGEGYDYFYNGDAKEAFDSDWAWKNIIHWWDSEHFDGTGTRTDWRPKMKPIWFTEMGFPSIHYATNSPNIFFNPECCDGGVPVNSSGQVDFQIQARALRSSLEVWRDSDCVQNIFIWAWDARPFPAYPENTDIWSDGPLWQYGHWITGKLREKGDIIIRSDTKGKHLVLNGAGRVYFDQK